jgi:hypothetical protein
MDWKRVLLVVVVMYFVLMQGKHIGNCVETAYVMTRSASTR